MDTPDVFAEILSLLASMERAQADKVIELARRIHPGLTAEDIRNPHDFPDLSDPDWHFEDGQLAGIQAVRFAIATLSCERSSGHGSAAKAREGDEEGRALLPPVLEDREGEG
ncbi:MAG TPA: hypothetical protein VGM56_21540 [Byssovorax sp.]